MNYYHVIGKSYYKCTWRLQREQSGGMRMGWDAVSKGSWRICGLHVENWIRDYKMKKRENNDINNNSTVECLPGISTAFNSLNHLVLTTISISILQIRKNFVSIIYPPPVNNIQTDPVYRRSALYQGSYMRAEGKGMEVKVTNYNYFSHFCSRDT